MILFLEFQRLGQRGGEQYHRKLHAFLSDRFSDVLPQELGPPPDNVRTRWQLLKHCVRLIDQHKPSLVVTDLSSAMLSYFALRCVRRYGGSVLLVAQGDRLPFSRRGRLFKLIARHMEKQCIRRADVAVVNSSYTAGLLQKRRTESLPFVIGYPGPGSGSEIGATPVDYSVNESPRLLYVGECSRVKGLIYLVEALSLLPDEVILDIAGGSDQEPDYFEGVKNLIDQRDLSGRIRIHGYVSGGKLASLYQQASILVVPSLSEGYGMVLVEGLRHGLPVVASRVGAIPEIITHNANGLLVPPAEPQALADAIAGLINDTEALQIMARENRRTAGNLPTWSDFDAVLEDELLPLLTPLLKKSHP